MEQMTSIPVCKTCKKPGILVPALAGWSEEAGWWELHSIKGGKNFCPTCQAHGEIEWFNPEPTTTE